MKNEESKSIDQHPALQLQNKDIYDLKSASDPKSNQVSFYKKDQSSTLIVKIIGPGLKLLNSMTNSPTHDKQLKEMGNLLTFGHRIMALMT
ncbi:hypothetical protein OAP56_04420 [Rickettsiaceae bacterium]|nr:hypothetical protein [Rickettsiaceae bacterium]